MTEEVVILKQWQEWNTQGFIPGPDETKAAFAERVAFCQHLEQNLVKNVKTDLPFALNNPTSKKLLQEVLPSTQELYGISPQWIPLFFSNYQLASWHGGCAWIFQLNEQTPTSAFLQLRAHFQNSVTYLGLYHRPELIAHELAHVGRMLYQDPQFEEMLAYQSSSSRWRRWLGPIVQSSTESLLFILCLGLVILSDFAFLSIPNLSTFAISWWIKLVPLSLLIFAFSRLFYRHQVFKSCLHHLETLYSSEKARHLIYRLRDSEIKQFARFSSSQIHDFIKTTEQTSFRWHFLNKIYPPSEPGILK